MKGIYNLLWIFMLVVGFSGCGGSGGGDDPTPPVDPVDPVNPVDPELKETKVNFTLKSGITGVEDAEVGTLMSHIRLYVFDKDRKLQKVEKYTAVANVKTMDFKAGEYTIVLLANVPDDENVVGETIGTALDEMSVQLIRKENATYYTPLGDVLLAKETMTVGETDMTQVLTVKRTLSATRVEMSDLSGKIANAGVLVPGVATEMGFGDAKWTKPGTVFMTMQEGVPVRSVEPKNYTISLNITVIREDGETEDKVECNIVARDENGSVVVTQAVNVPVESKPNAEITVNVEIKTNGENGEIEVEVKKVEVSTDGGEKEDKTDEIEVIDHNINIDLLPGDWETGNDESVDVDDSDKPTHGNIIPGGKPSDWEGGSDESVDVDECDKPVE